MTTATDRRIRDRIPWPWLCSLVALTVLSVAYLWVLYRAVDIDGDPNLFFLFVGGAAVAGLLLGRFAGPVIASLCVGVLVAGGTMLYVSTIPNGYSIIISLDALRTDIVALLTGLSIFQIINAGVWATAVAPVPTFLTAYFTARHRYSWATFVGCLALGFLILTGDVTATIGLIGVLGATAAIGFGDLARHNTALSGADALVIVLAVIVVLTASVSVVPGGESSPILDRSNGDRAQTVEGSLTRAGSQLSIQGSISLDPAVRFSIESDQKAYWRVGAYDRYTGTGWVRTANDRAYEGKLSKPPGTTDAVRQRVRVKAPISTMPAAWKPISVENRSPRVTGFDGLQPSERLAAGDTYTVTSAVLQTDPAALRNASNEYPGDIRQRYTQLPDSTPDQVDAYTSTVTENADNSYDTARVIEHHLQENWNYSLNVQRPDEHVANSFLFEMERGYCTHFATTMVTMLRTQGIPARLAVGYAPGESADGNRWTVRGLDSHAWVEVYFPDHGWVQFDPTPAAPREQAEQDAVNAANSGDVDDGTQTPSPTDQRTDRNRTASNTSSTQTPVNRSDTTTTPVNTTDQDTHPDSDRTDSISSADDNGISLPTWEQTVFGTIVALGAIATIRRNDVTERAYRAVWLRRQPRADPERDIERAFDRLEYLLEHEHRPRRSGETRRQYVLEVGGQDDRRVAEIYEQAVYAGDPSQSLADEAVEIVNQRVKKHSIV
ncbi:transglutaminase TgpA family protein [Halocatena salina]|uniref:DUF3488 and transglutaminase-like domain-containing protein n=1 Tax=Halocatena salina TaxID=2934340 RepID=A0A8U0A333_9EURY|nr:transglutaminaseTgpA domain-containing protein [Halocatena salina]UPM43605.1 DUF3488 and transglutaminase-like domain-containing protein [Halocatena salina]